MPQRRGRHPSSRIQRHAFRQEQPLSWELKSDSSRSGVLGQLKSAKKKRNYGTVDLREEQYAVVLEKISRRRRPKLHRVQHTNPDVLKKLGRDERMVLLKCLSNKSACIHVYVRRQRVTERKGDEVDLATILILSIALRGGYSSLVGELIGLSTPDTVIKLKKYIRRPLMKPKMVVTLVHATARNVTQDRTMNGLQHGSSTLLRVVPCIIALVFANLKDSHIESLQGIFQTLVTKWPEGYDRGIKVGLMLSGLQISIRAILDRGRKTLGYVNLALKFFFGLFSGIPAGGAAFAATAPVVEKILDNRNASLDKKYTQLWEKIWETFHDKVETLLPRSSREDKRCYREYKRGREEVMTAELPSLKD